MNASARIEESRFDEFVDPAAEARDYENGSFDSARRCPRHPDQKTTTTRGRPLGRRSATTTPAGVMRAEDPMSDDKVGAVCTGGCGAWLPSEPWCCQACTIKQLRAELEKTEHLYKRLAQELETTRSWLAPLRRHG
jgi:hypothetical protein